MSDPIRRELSNDPQDYMTGPTAGDNPTEGGTQKDGSVALFRQSTMVRPVDPAESTPES